MLTELDAQQPDHCERHQVELGGPHLLLVRTLDTVAHDDEGGKSPVCSWEVFQDLPLPVRHLATFDECGFEIRSACIHSLGDPVSGAAPAPLWCPAGS